jgi:tetratricopeptide (TPR) repeat protein
MIKCVATVLAVFLAASTVRAEDCPSEAPEDSSLRRVEAKKWFARGEAEAQANNDVAAIKDYQCSLMFVPHGSTAYNVAQLAEKTGDLELAIASYEQYLELAERAEDAAEVRERVETLKAKLAKVRENERAAGSGGTSPLDMLGKAQGEQGTAAEPDVRAPSTPEPGVSRTGHRKTDLRMVGWLTAGGGGVLVLGGILTNVLARGQMDTCREEYDKGNLSTAESACSNAKPLAYMSYAFIGVGAAAVATGAVLMFIKPQEPSDVDVAVLPEGGLTLSYSGRF